MTDQTNIYPKGTILLFEEGEYSNFGYCGQTVTLRELNLRAEIKAWRENLGKDEDGDWIADNYGHGPSKFVADLIARQIVAPLDCQTVHIGSYGKVEI